MKKRAFALYRRLGPCAALGVLLGASLLAAPAFAQSQAVGEVTVVAPHAVRKTVGTTSSGIPIELVSLSRQVSYSDLDLTTAAGVGALKDRVVQTAKEACADLDRIFPSDLTEPANQDCVKSASEGGLAQVDLIMAAAAGK